MGVDHMKISQRNKSMGVNLMKIAQKKTSRYIIILQGYKESDKKHENKVSMKSTNMENINSEFRKKLKNLLTEFNDIFEGIGKLKYFKFKLFVDE